MNGILKEYILGDMVAHYSIDENKHVGLLLYPKQITVPEEEENNKAALDSLVQLKLVGDVYNGAYAPGNTMREGESVKRLQYTEQSFTDSGELQQIETVLKDERGYTVSHYLKWKKGTPYIRVATEFQNNSNKKVELELLSSYSIQGISSWMEKDADSQIMVHRLRSRWSAEGKLETQSLEDLQLETSWTKEAVRCERFGSVGSMPVNRYFPFLAMEDTKYHIFWGAQLAVPSSWQMEIYRLDENIAIDGGLGDREFAHWMKSIEPGESFLSPEAILTVCETDSIDILTNRLTEAGKEAFIEKPACEQELPIIFNEYCTTWGCPSHENIMQILNSIKGKGFSYFVIDCGWYKEEGVPWDISMGDYNISRDLFPGGLEKTVAAIREAGMKPGIWFEIENVGPASEAYNNTEHLLKRDGHVLTTNRRRFWNMNDPWVQEYLDNRIIGLLKKYGFEYLKVDYNDEIGIGSDGYESIGEGLRINLEETYRYFEKLEKEVPGLILENCASGGHRLEPGFMARSSMASFSDAHECVEIPIIAANLHRAILPCQSQIWAVIRETDSLKRIVYSITNTFLGRMCISGDVTNLSQEQWSVIDSGMAFYKKISSIIKDGQSYRYGTEITSMSHPKGWQGLVRIGSNKEALVTIHIFGGQLPDEIIIPLPQNAPTKINEIYAEKQENVSIINNVLHYVPDENDKALAIRLS